MFALDMHLRVDMRFRPCWDQYSWTCLFDSQYDPNCLELFLLEGTCEALNALTWFYLPCLSIPPAKVSLGMQRVIRSHLLGSWPLFPFYLIHNHAHSHVHPILYCQTRFIATEIIMIQDTSQVCLHTIFLLSSVFIFILGLHSKNYEWWMNIRKQVENGEIRLPCARLKFKKDLFLTFQSAYSLASLRIFTTISAPVLGGLL